MLLRLMLGQKARLGNRVVLKRTFSRSTLSSIRVRFGCGLGLSGIQGLSLVGPATST